MMNMTEWLRLKYERDIGEPWEKLEQDVRSRHADLFAMLDSLEK